MAVFNIHKVSALPGSPAANSVYLVSSGANHIEMYVTGTSPATIRRMYTEADIQTMIEATVAGMSTLQVVADITERNALSPTENVIVLVLNATGDATVASGAATYVYRHSTTTWVKISEAESMDVTVAWASISGRPTATPSQIDTAVSQSHTHSNLSVLNALSDSAGSLRYGGQPLSAEWAATDW